MMLSGLANIRQCQALAADALILLFLYFNN